MTTPRSATAAVASAVALTAALSAALVGHPSAQSGRAPNARVDAVFAEFDKPGSPGCALAVVDHGAIAYARGYGRASLELDIPITPQTVFDIGSTSKQFTAFSVLLLEKDGRLSLDDDIRKYLPEMPDYGHTITIRHLLSHTSGLRDYTALLPLDGNETADHTTPRDALEILVRQKALNFNPGDEWSYSNTGFFLASLIVQRVSGQNLAEFARARIFEPLGMSRSQYQDNTRVIPHKATGYSPRPGGGFNLAMTTWMQLGDGAVQTTVEDLAKWDANAYEPKVGDRQILERSQTPGRLNSGKAHHYGLGLTINTYRGLRRVVHGGSWAGYRAMLMRFPDQHTSVLLTCNVASARTSDLAEGVADVWLEQAGLGPRPTSTAARMERPQPPVPSDEQLAAYTGHYHTPELTTTWTVTAADHKLWIRFRKGDGEPLTPSATDQFAFGGTSMTFERNPASHAVVGIKVDNRGLRNFRLARVASMSSSQ